MKNIYLNGHELYLFSYRGNVNKKDQSQNIAQFEMENMYVKKLSKILIKYNSLDVK